MAITCAERGMWTGPGGTLLPDSSSQLPVAPQPAALRRRRRRRLQIPSFSANWHLITTICAQSESWLPRDASPLASFQSDAGFLVLAKMSASDTSDRN